MIRRAALFLLLPAALTASEPLDALGRARAETEAAEKRQQALEVAAGKARGEAAKLHARQEVAIAGIDLAEARMAEAGLALAEARQRQRIADTRLAEARAPAASLVAGVVTMARRPPLLILADGGSIDQLVRIRALLDTSLPAIRSRSAALAGRADVAAARTAESTRAAAALNEERSRLDAARTRFAQLEGEAQQRASALEGDAFLAADRVIAGSDEVGTLGRAAERAAEARTTASRLARLEPLPARPGPLEQAATGLPFPYRLPGPFPVSEGMGSVNEIGVAARGVTLEAPRGSGLVVPADGTVLFAGPYRRFDGLVIIDHGHGWTSLVINVRPSVAKGARVRMGEPLGNALGPVSVEFNEKGNRRSAALIARSSLSLSNGGANR